MAEDGRKTGDDASRSGAEDAGWAGLLRGAARRLVPIVVSTGSLLTFVAFAGAVIVWTRLNAVEVAPDQAITAFPRSELVSIGASLLLLYGFFGALAVLGALLIDRGGRPTQGMAYGLLFLLTAEGVVAIATAAEFGSSDWVAAMLLFLFPIAFAAWVLGLGPSRIPFSELRDELPSRPTETRPPIRIWTALRPPPTYLENGEGGDARWGIAEGRRRFVRLLVCTSVVSAVIGAVFAAIALSAQAQNVVLLVGLGIFALLFACAAGVALVVNSRGTRPQREEVRAEEEEETARLAAAEEFVAGLGDDDTQAGSSDMGRRIAELRLAGRRPYRLYLTWPGVAVVVPTLLVAAVLPAWQLGEIWLGAALASAVVICMWLWRVSVFTRDKVIWFGLAVFLSVPLFGTFMSMARNIDDPQIQPVALIRSTDRPDEAIHGLYVTEAKERVYFASVATEGCTGSLRENSGRLLWVPKDELVAMSIGPLQRIGDAAKTSLEMAFALTPAVETPAGDSVSLTPREARSEEGGLGEEVPLTVQRLENVGPAVRPTFGRGLELEPEDAKPGEAVTLKMNTPIENGFGTHRDGRSLRVGGTPAKISINPVRDGERAEFVATEAGPPLKLDKELGVYVEVEDGEFVRDDDALADENEDEGRFVKLIEDTRVAGTDYSDEDGRLYLPIEEEDRADVVAVQKVDLRDGTTAVLEPDLHRQAWNKDEIKFELPEKASSGVVTVDCEQLAGQPLVRVPRPPEARIKARMLSSGKIALDSRRSSDDDGLVSRRWTVNGRPRRVEGAATAVLPISRRLAIHRIRLTVEDADGESDTATLHLLRVPRPSIAFDGKRDGSRSGSQGKAPPKRPGMVRRLRRAVVGRATQETPIAVMVDAHARDETGPRRVAKSQGAARATIGRLLNWRTAKEAELEASVPVVTRAFGEGCAYVAPGSHKDRHVDVFILGEGAGLGKPRPCDPRHVKKEKWEAGGDDEAGGDQDRRLGQNG